MIVIHRIINICTAGKRYVGFYNLNLKKSTINLIT